MGLCGAGSFLFVSLCEFISTYTEPYVFVIAADWTTWIEKGLIPPLLTLHPTYAGSVALRVIYSYAGADETTD